MSRNATDLYCVASAITRVGTAFLESQREALCKHIVTSSLFNPTPITPPTHVQQQQSPAEQQNGPEQPVVPQQEEPIVAEKLPVEPKEEPVATPTTDHLDASIKQVDPEIAQFAEQLEAVSNQPVYEAIAQEPLEQRKALKESRIPTTRAGRLWHYGTLGMGLGVGAINESFKRATGLSKNKQGSVILSERNVDLLVDKISRMRGAALKMGQMLSIQGIQAASDTESWIPPQIEQVLLKVHDSANYMPQKQMEAVMAKELGKDWQSQFQKFDPVPIAAASIGQVHQATLPGGENVVIKVQYPGVRESIDSDLNNLMAILTFSNLLPRGMYLDNTIRVTKQELAWECDYVREANNTERYRALIGDDLRYKVPQVYKDLCSPNILVLERLQGRVLSKAVMENQGLRNTLGESLLRLCLREVFSFRFMQTDPNWSNFFYNPSSGQVELLDFGACREFGTDFLSLYGRILKAAAAGDREGVWEFSEKLGFVTGYETAVMREAHIDSVMVLGEPFRKEAPDTFDFGVQTITGRVRDTIPVMLRHRLTPPPDETYGLHKKLSGAFLLCTKLGSKFDTKAVWRDEVERLSL
ncbi:ABC1 family-domain-containing protein [Fennellomyces sp. T-0311]|nr:ABC1 family-domain-containing protein [Fennellomyces sp. T-0311]